jgi:hypothetical protein
VRQDWGNFATIAGSASAALTGLLFVAVSLNRERVTNHPALRGEAGQTLVLFLLPLLVAILLVIPGTSGPALGAGIIVLAFLAGTALILIGERKRPDGDGPEDSLARLLDSVSPNLLTMVLIVAAGCLQLAGDDGLYLLAIATVLSLLGGVINAWLFLTRLALARVVLGGARVAAAARRPCRGDPGL